RLFRRNCRAPSQQIYVADVRLPPRVEQIAGQRNQPTNKIDRDVQSHAQQRDLRHAITDRRNQNIKRDDGRGDIAKLRDEIDDGVETETPTQNGKAKLVVHYLAEDF